MTPLVCLHVGCVTPGFSGLTTQWSGFSQVHCPPAQSVQPLGSFGGFTCHHCRVTGPCLASLAFTQTSKGPSSVQPFFTSFLWLLPRSTSRSLPKSPEVQTTLRSEERRVGQEGGPGVAVWRA